MRTVQNALERHYQASGFNVAVQDGASSGQSVPHVHVHILPRIDGDFERNDDIYDCLQDWAPTSLLQEMKQNSKSQLDVPDDQDRKDRTMQQMEEESQIYRNLIESESNN